MVQFTKTDLQAILIFSLFLIVISFVFPVLGFTAGDVKQNDIPEFNASQNQFNDLGDPPDLPNNPSQGQLKYIHGAQVGEDNRQIWLQGDSTEGYSIVLINTGTQSNPSMEVNINRFNTSGSYNRDSAISENQYVNLQIGEYEVGFQDLELRDNNEIVVVAWEVLDQPDNKGWVDRIPVVGGVVSGGEQLASFLGWIGSLIFYGIAQVVVGAYNIFVALLNLITFIFQFLYWLLSTYADVTTAAPTSWAALFMTIPGVVLSFEFGKLVLIIVKTVFEGIPFT